MEYFIHYYQAITMLIVKLMPWKVAPIYALIDGHALQAGLAQNEH